MVADAIQPRISLDMRGKECPLPVLRAKLAMLELEPGEVLEVLATDPHASVDFQAFCARSGHELVLEDQQGGVLRFCIRRIAGTMI